MQPKTGLQVERAVVSLAAPDNQRASASGLSPFAELQGHYAY
ncbi:hypothetical protein GME_19247 [Halomonas sp. TD01]|nr:hypothetical protein GME_19247 [Halomonas sp. TD01]